MEKGKLWGHSWRFTLTRRCFMGEEASLGSSSHQAHAGVEMTLKSNSRAAKKMRIKNLKELKKTKTNKKNHYFLILTCVTQHLIKGTEHNMK